MQRIDSHLPFIIEKKCETETLNLCRDERVMYLHLKSRPCIERVL